MAWDRRSRGSSGTDSRPGTGGGLGTGRGSGLGGGSRGFGGFGGFGPRGVADPTGVWRDPSVAVGTVLISAVAVSATVVSTVMIVTVAVRPRLGGLLVPSGDPSSLGLYRGLHPLAQFGGHRRRCRRSRPGFGCALYALRKLLLGAVYISHSVTPCATRTREDADRMVQRNTRSAQLQANLRKCDACYPIPENGRLPAGRHEVASGIVSGSKSAKSPPAEEPAVTVWFAASVSARGRAAESHQSCT